MRWTFLILIFWLSFGGPQNTWATGCPTASQFIQSILDPKEYYSAVRRIEREQKHSKTDWLANLTYEELKRSVPLEIEVKNQIQGKLEKKFFRGYAIPGNPQGNAIERYADALKRNTGHTLIISDDAVHFADAYGYQDSKIRVRSLNQRIHAKIDVIVFNSDVLHEIQIPTLIPHESTHGYFQKLNEIGKGTSHSITFYDRTPLKEGELDFYKTFQSLEEQLTWMQDLVRKSRKLPESKVQQLFRQSGMVTREKVIRFDPQQLARTKAVFETAKPRLENAIVALEKSQKRIEQDFEKLALKRNGKPRERIMFEFGKNERVDIPINTLQERDLIAKYERADRASQTMIKQELIQIWKNKLKEQLALNQKTIQNLNQFDRYFHELELKPKITYEEYRKFRAYLTQMAKDLQIRSTSSP